MVFARAILLTKCERTPPQSGGCGVLSRTQYSCRENENLLNLPASGGTLGILSDFRRLPAAIHQLVAVLRDLATLQRDAGPAVDRIAALELSRHQFQAEIEGMLLRAEGKLKAASNAEARERQLKRSYEKQLDPFDPDSAAGQERRDDVVPTGDAAAIDEAQVQPVRVALAPNNKAAAVSAKWGR